MKSFFRLVLVFTLFIGVVGFICASGKAEPKQEQITLKWYQWWYSDPVRGKNVEYEITEFQKLYPNVKIEPLASTNTAYWDRVALDIANGVEGDIITLDTGAGMNQYYNQRPGGAFIALDQYIEGYVLPDGTSLEKDIVLLDQMKRNGKTIALPFIWFAAPETVYRKSQLAKAGVDPSQLSTWDGYKNAAKALTKDGVFGFGQPTRQEVLSRWWLMNWLWTAGGGIFPNEEGPYTADRLVFNSAANVYALTYLKNLLAESGPSGDKSYDELQALFANGNLATMQIAIWGVGNLQNDMKPAGSFESDFGLAPFPTATINGKKMEPIYVAWGNPIAISSNCKHPKEAFDFVAFLHSKAVQERETVVASPVNKKAMDYYKEKYPVQYQYLQDAQKYKFLQVPDLANWTQWDHIIQQTLNAALLGTASVKDALDEGQKQMLKLLEN